MNKSAEFVIILCLYEKNSLPVVKSLIDLFI